MNEKELDIILRMKDTGISDDEIKNVILRDSNNIINGVDLETSDGSNLNISYIPKCLIITIGETKIYFGESEHDLEQLRLMNDIVNRFINQETASPSIMQGGVPAVHERDQYESLTFKKEEVGFITIRITSERPDNMNKVVDRNDFTILSDEQAVEFLNMIELYKNP